MLWALVLLLDLLLAVAFVGWLGYAAVNWLADWRREARRERSRPLPL